MKAITLFTSAGIGDLAIRKNGIDIIVANEIVPSRVSLHKRNFPETEMIEGDIWLKKDEIIETTRKKLGRNKLDFIFATPPCQAMSKNGQGKLLQSVRDGSKSKFDPRNQLIVPTMDIIVALQPTTVFFENVPEMENTLILDEKENPINIIDYIKKRLGSEYVGKPEVVHFADFGIPQRRTRLITIFSRLPEMKSFFKSHGSFIPHRTHSKNARNGLKKWVTVRETISNLPKLDSKDKSSAVSNIPFHRVPVLDETKYFWVSNTPPEKGAFDNQCINKECLFKQNPTHGATKNGDGVNQANKDTPLYCTKCGSLLPRPATIDKNTGKARIMSGYTSAYKRMSWDLPSSTLTTNLSYPCSDQKLHPEQNRVLSLYEAFKLHTLDQFEYVWEHHDGSPAKDTTVREVIGESIPPKAIDFIVEHLLDCLVGKPKLVPNQQLNLLYCTC